MTSRIGKNDRQNQNMISKTGNTENDKLQPNKKLYS